jgi:hypothetical protein
MCIFQNTKRFDYLFAKQQVRLIKVVLLLFYYKPICICTSLLLLAFDVRHACLRLTYFFHFVAGGLRCLTCELGSNVKGS